MISNCTIAKSRTASFSKRDAEQPGGKSQALPVAPLMGQRPGDHRLGLRRLVRLTRRQLGRQRQTVGVSHQVQLRAETPRL